MTMVTNLRHFLDEEDEIPNLPLEAMTLLSFLGSIVEAATIAYDKPITMADVNCRAAVDGKTCLGEIETWVYAENNNIGWECLECGDDGIISEWVGTIWDRRDYVRH